MAEESTHHLLLPLAFLLFLSSAWFVRRHARRDTSFVVSALATVGFGLGSATVALLPIDLSYASESLSSSSSASGAGGGGDGGGGGGGSGVDGEDGDGGSMDNPTLAPWKFTYWTTFLLAWLILPIARETLLSGHFTLRKRLDDGIRRSFRSLFLMFCAGVLSIVAVAVHLKSVRIHTAVMPVLMALGNTYGLVLVCVLLGNGLVTIPKRYWREACPANELRRARIVACAAEEELFEAVMGLEDAEEQVEECCRTAVRLRDAGDDDEGEAMDHEGEGAVRLGAFERGRRATRCGVCCRVDEVTEFHECLEELVRRKNETADLCSERRTRRGGGSLRRRGSDGSRDGTDEAGGEVNAMDVKHLVNLNRRLLRAQERVASAQLRWDHLVERGRLFAHLMDDGAERAGSSDEIDGGARAGLLSSASTPKCCRKARRSLQRLWVRCLRYPTYRFLAVATATLSVFVLMGETTLAAPVNLSPFSWTLHAIERMEPGSTTRVLFQIAALVPLLYMSLCVYACLFQMSLLGPYCLRGNRRSHGVALAFNAQYLVRLQFPLGYNYLLMLKYDTSRCAFSDVMSDMTTVPFLGTSFSVYAPLLVLAACMFTLCDVYPRALRWAGVEHEDALLLGDEDELDAKVSEGIQLMKRDAERRGGGVGGGREGGGRTTTGGGGSAEKQSLKGGGSANVVV
ncbi:hypothetical protein ACHAWF_013830 [Thalassiosira exigua]